MNTIDNILNFKQTGIKIEKARLLVSTPLLNDFYFGHSVVLLLEHEPKGSIGLVLNKKTDQAISNLIPELEGISSPIFIGGPVEHNHVFYIHKNAAVEDSNSIGTGLFWGGNIHQISDFIKEGIIPLSDIKFFIGYSGWGANQLEEELKSNSWIVSHIEAAGDILTSDSDSMWKTTIKNQKLNYKSWFNFPVNPQDN